MRLPQQALKILPTLDVRARLYALVVGLVVVSDVWAQASAASSLPFAPGERLTYSARSQKLGATGKGEMWIEGPVDIRGISTWRLRFEVKAGVGPFGGSQRSSSWIDAARMTALRYSRHERRALKGRSEEVEMFPDSSRWTGQDGKSGVSPTALPLDELSYIYFIRTLPLLVDSVYSMERHFDAARNPTVIRVTGRDTIVTKAGTFSTLRVEMTVKDARNYDKVGVIRLYLSDDERRVPVRIESEMPLVGTVTLTLESQTLPARAVVAKAPK